MNEIRNDSDENAFTAQQKWGEAAGTGFQMVPDVLFKHQATMKLTATELVVLLNVLMHWWTVDRLPFPKTSLIAQRMGLDQRSVQRVLRSLVKKKILKKVVADNDRHVWDPSPLVGRLEGLAKLEPRYQQIAA